jgi:hypothetical protein
VVDYRGLSADKDEGQLLCNKQQVRKEIFVSRWNVRLEIPEALDTQRMDFSRQCSREAH